jgi:maleylpyruvate isomerase
MTGRVDRVTDPVVASELLVARRGQAYFSRKLNELSNEELGAPSLLPGWSKAHVVAHVGYNARAIARLVEWAGTGVETPMYESPEQRGAEIALGATLSPRALRHLSDHAAVHLDVSWRDLPAERWAERVKTALGRTVPVSETVWMRTREVWLHAIDLDNGARFGDVPDVVFDRLLVDITTTWAARGEGTDLLIVPSDRVAPTGTGVREVHGSMAQILRWAVGRGLDGVTGVDGQPVEAAPRWI